MKVRTLQENLRRAIARRIQAGELTGLRLAQQTGFKQAHISNFLNRKRSLSIEGMDNVLSVQRLSVLDLLDPEEVNKRASIPPPSADDFENVIVTDASIAASRARITSSDVRDILKFKKNFLRRLRADMATDRAAWQRFVLVKVDADGSFPMYPRLTQASTVLIDRHYNSLRPYRRGEANMYATISASRLIIRYVEPTGDDNVVLRPHNQACPVSLLAIEPGKSVSDYIIGRICHVANET